MSQNNIGKGINTEGAIKNGKSKNNDNIGHTRHRTNKTQKHDTIQKTKKMSNTNLTKISTRTIKRIEYVKLCLSVGVF
jgi:hypothetical protein